MLRSLASEPMTEQAEQQGGELELIREDQEEVHGVHQVHHHHVTVLTIEEEEVEMDDECPPTTTPANHTRTIGHKNSNSSDITNTSSIATDTLETPLRGPLVSGESMAKHKFEEEAQGSSSSASLDHQQKKPLIAFEISGPSLSYAKLHEKENMLETCSSFLLDWCFTILIGFFVVSFWRVCNGG